MATYEYWAHCFCCHVAEGHKSRGPLCQPCWVLRLIDDQCICLRATSSLAVTLNHYSSLQKCPMRAAQDNHPTLHEGDIPPLCPFEMPAAGTTMEKANTHGLQNVLSLWASMLLPHHMKLHLVATDGGSYWKPDPLCLWWQHKRA